MRLCVVGLLVAAVASSCQCGNPVVSADGGETPDGGPGTGGGTGGAGPADAGDIDAGNADAGIVDAGIVDAGSVDAGGVDAGLADGGSADAGPCTPQHGACSNASSCCGGLACLAAGGGVSGTLCEPDPATGCGLNSTRCAAACVTTVTDPENCGGCGLRCAADAGQVCTGGACRAASSCPQGLTACNGTCVDLQTSSTSCGACGTPCPAGQGCAGGACVTSVSLLDAGVLCAGGGPPVRVSDAGVCAGALAQVTFRWALCSCGAVGAGQSLTTDAFNSRLGPYADGGLGGSVGANGGFQTGSPFDIAGVAWIGGDAGMDFGSRGNRVWQDLLVNGPLNNGGDLWVGGSAWINGNANGQTRIAGTLSVPTGSVVGAGVVADGGVVITPVTVPPPCDCGTSQLIDVAGIVRDGQQRNDNLAIGLDPDALNSQGAGYRGARRLDLPCGRYYLSAIRAGSAIAIAVHGRAAIFVGGDVDMGSPFAVTIDPDAEVDVFIGGTINSGANLSFGSTEVPAQSRVYVAGNSMSLGGSNIVVAGNFYLPFASFSNGNPMSVYGSMFTGSYSGGPLTIHYDTAVQSSGQQCASTDAGPVACNSCRDCGNQACVGQVCGACTTTLDCCAPFSCSRGRCIPP